MSEALGVVWLVFGGIFLVAGKEFAKVILCFGFATVCLGFAEIKYILKPGQRYLEIAKTNIKYSLCEVFI